ncbi:MAG: pseudouridine synthase [Pseudomonadota bacterium]
MMTNQPIRLQRFLSQAGVAARRKAEQLITSGRVRVNGRVARELGVKVDPRRAVVEVDGRRVEPEPLVYLVLNKPKGYVSTVSDPQGRETVMSLLPPGIPKVAPIGRLDYYTEGVLLFTNDGELAAALLAPRSKVEKTYHAKVRGAVDPEDLDRLRRGVRLGDGRMTQPARIDVAKHTGQHTWLLITITEGRSRQIHHMAEALGYQILKLARLAFGGIAYHGLRVGEHRYLTPQEVRRLRRLAGIDQSK